MWTKITQTNSDLIKEGTSICQNHPNINTIRPDEKNQTLETIYQVETIDGTGDIILNTDNIINATGFKGKRTVDRKKLKNEGWFAWL